ncbi:MAG: M48 family metallopeptidase [Candidatus Eisenbacteria bacterium]
MTDAPQRATFYELQAANRRSSFLLILAFFGFVAFLGWGLDVFILGFGMKHEFGVPVRFPFFTLFAIAWGVFHAAVSWFGGAGEVLRATMARPARAEDPLEKQFLNVVEEMAIAAGLPLPKAYVVPDDDPNAFAVGRDPEHAAIAVTRGLLEKLDRDELQGVVGHEMAHVRNLDIRSLTLVTALFGASMLMSDMARHSLGRTGRDQDEGRGSGGVMLLAFVVWMFVAILAPVLARLLALSVSRSREYLADASAVELTRNPLGLAAALRKLDAAHEPTQLISQGSAHLCITDPRGLKINEREGPVADWLGTHPPIARRVALLEGMAGVLGVAEGVREG